jgi:hypothetical protein
MSRRLERAVQPEALPTTAALPATSSSLSSLLRRRLKPAAILSELDSYLASGITVDDDLLRFWKAREGMSPIFAQMAKDVLAVPISGVGVERTFSVARQLCTDQRHKLDVQTIRKRLLVRQRERLLTKQDEAGNHKTRVSSYSDADIVIADEQYITDDDDYVETIFRGLSAPRNWWCVSTTVVLFSEQLS